MKLYRPFVKLSIPSDIPQSEHVGIAAKITALNERLHYMICDQEEAILYAASGLSRSGVGACGIPKAMPMSNPAAVSLGRKGGQATTERKRQSSKVNALKASQAAKAKRDALKNRG